MARIKLMVTLFTLLILAAQSDAASRSKTTRTVKAIVPLELKAARAEQKAGDLVGAYQTYQAYLKAHPNDEKAVTEAKKLEADPAYRKQVLDSGFAPNFRGRPRDAKTFQLMFELLTPLGAGFDLSVYADRHHNFGFGYAAGGATTSIYSFHPRYRYYRGRTHWDSFFEFGGVFYGMRHPSANSYQTFDFRGGNLGYGVNVINSGVWTMQFLLSLNVGTATAVQPYSHSYTTFGPGPAVTTVTTRGSDTYNYIYGYPLIGWGWGLVF